MSLEELGWEQNRPLERDIDPAGSDVPGRVIAEHRERYQVQTESATVTAEITGNLRFNAMSREDFPAVGDWVRLTPIDNDAGIIHEIYPRTSVLKRQTVGEYGEIQIIATNIDYSLIMQAVGHDFNLKRLERYLTICHAAGIEPVVILSKIDLIDDLTLKEVLEKTGERVPDVTVLGISNYDGSGFSHLIEIMQPYKTYCVLGSSGVGKSTLINQLQGREMMETSHINTSTGKGRHTTSHRQLSVLPNQSIVIDTPGMRELGIADATSGIEQTYDRIQEMASKCKFRNCTHTEEQGCAILAAIEDGSLEYGVYENYMKLLRERERFSKSLFEKRRQSKAQGKLYKNIQKERRKKKF